MLVKFLSHGKGSAKAAAKYLVGELDAEGREREGVEVWRGNPDMVAAVADSLDFERKYIIMHVDVVPYRSVVYRKAMYNSRIRQFCTLISVFLLC